MWVERKITAKAFSRLVSIRNVKQELLKSNLTRREGEIVRLVIQGYSTKHISTVLGIRKQTVKNYLRNIFKKFGVSNRIHLVAKILGEGIPQLHSMINVSGVSINARPKTTNRC
ncbi:MAG: response regulator transcription factor [Ignavibacteriales bacterium]